MDHKITQYEVAKEEYPYNLVKCKLQSNKNYCEVRNAVRAGSRNTKKLTPIFLNELINFQIILVVICSQHEVKNWIHQKDSDEAQKNSPNSFKPKLIILFLMFSQELFNQFLDAITSLDLGYECKKERKKERK